jgi:hypothetical protein
MKIYKKTARKDPSGRVVHTCDGVDYVRRKSADGTFKFRLASASATSSKAKSKSGTRSTVSKRRTKRARYSGGGYQKLPRLQELMPPEGYFQWNNPPGLDMGTELTETLINAVGRALATNDARVIKNSTRYKMFHKFIQTRIAERVIKETAAPGSPLSSIKMQGIQFIMHNPGMYSKKIIGNKTVPPPTEMRLLLWYGVYDSDDYYHFARPKNMNVRKHYEWVGHHGGDRLGQQFGIIGIKRNHIEGVKMSADEYLALSGHGYVNDLESDEEDTSDEGSSSSDDDTPGNGGPSSGNGGPSSGNGGPADPPSTLNPNAEPYTPRGFNLMQARDMSIQGTSTAQGIRYPSGNRVPRKSADRNATYEPNRNAKTRAQQLRRSPTRQAPEEMYVPQTRGKQAAKPQSTNYMQRVTKAPSSGPTTKPGSRSRSRSGSSNRAGPSNRPASGSSTSSSGSIPEIIKPVKKTIIRRNFGKEVAKQQ